MTSLSTGCVFQLKVDPLTGNSEWVVIEEDEEEGFLGSSHKHLLASTSYLDMLNDSRRNKAYREAIDKTITKQCRVLDIGAGTGLLSMMASRAMQSASTSCDSGKGRVIACESYLPMVKLMKKVFRLNGMERNIHVINKRSDELQVGFDIPSRADVLVSEILDSEVLGEGLIPTLQHAHENLLVENSLTVPYKATTYGQLVESEFLWRLNDLHGNEAEIADGVKLVPPGHETILGIKPQQYAMHCDEIEDLKPLSEPFKIFEFVFWKRPDSYGETELHLRATNDGRVHAVVSWWILQLDREGEIFYSTAPRWINSSSITDSSDWRDHWKQCVWFFPGRGISIFKEEEIHINAIHNETSISYTLKQKNPRNELMLQSPNAEDLQVLLSPERIAIYGDRAWRLSMLTALKHALQAREHSLCMIADDSLFLSLLVSHLSQTARVISLCPGLGNKIIQYLQAVAHTNGFSMDCVEVLDKRIKHLTMHDTHQKKVDLLIGEPFYYGHDGMLPWQKLRFWKDRTILDSILSEDAEIMPRKGILKACAMSLPDLWKSRCCLNNVEGFDHSVVNSTLGACGNLDSSEETPCLPFFIWQCGEFKVLSETSTIMEFDFYKLISFCQGKAQFEFSRPGICHGFAMWIDWVIDSENSIVVSTGPDTRCWKQGVKLLAKPVEVAPHTSKNAGQCYSAVLEASFDPVNGELRIVHDFL